MIELFSYNREDYLQIKPTTFIQEKLNCDVRAKLKWCNLKCSIIITTEVLANFREQLQSLVDSAEQKLCCLNSADLAIHLKFHPSGSIVWNIQLKNEKWDCSFGMKADRTAISEVVCQIGQDMDDLVSVDAVLPNQSAEPRFLMALTSIDTYSSLWILEFTSNDGNFWVCHQLKIEDEEINELVTGLNNLLRYGSSFDFAPLDDFIHLSFKKDDEGQYEIYAIIQQIESGRIRFQGRLDEHNLYALTSKN